MTLLDAAYEIVAIGSVSRAEGVLADHVASVLAAAPHLEVVRVGDNVVARTRGNRPARVIVAGHLDTVPGDAAAAHVAGDRLVGVGACDMKGSLSVMLAQACESAERGVEVTWIFYAREEIVRTESGLLELADARPDLLEADAALLAEPTGGVVEAGCQGSMRVEVTVRGTRAHTARPYVGRNAIHRLAHVIDAVASYTPRVATIDGIDYTEQMQVVAVDGGVAANVVPDVARCSINHRVAPDRTRKMAESALRNLVGEALDADDEFVVRDWSPPAAPALGHPMIARLVDATGQPARAKAGWTDVATFFERGVPAANYGAGDPLLAHRSDEFVTAAELREFDAGLRRFLTADA